ncbi:enoyl-CoA hydratase-related protein [Streptomyces sp. NPDC051976]|uniref:enoyl-CoA hydratase-related protein n=1 Tax=Streptomyces sp. NPDC051976 TaxID=3154947 RepID=UPI003427A3E2
MVDHAASLRSELVLSERRGQVQILTFNRPDRLNAWNDELEDLCFALLDEADADPDVRAIVITGAGRGFCSGADMADLARVSECDDGFPPPRPRPRTFPLTMRKPMIAAINGAAAGLGLVEALYCDVRFASPDAKITAAFSRRGLIAEYGIAWLLPRLIGVSKALDLRMTSRIVDGAEALSLGLVNHVVDGDSVVDEAVAYATELVTFCSPYSIGVMKSQIWAGLHRDFTSAVAEGDRLLLESFVGPDLREGVQSYLEGRSPRFAGLGRR